MSVVMNSNEESHVLTSLKEFFVDLEEMCVDFINIGRAR
jgi:hypothetical protein